MDALSQHIPCILMADIDPGLIDFYSSFAFLLFQYIKVFPIQSFWNFLTLSSMPPTPQHLTTHSELSYSISESLVLSSSSPGASTEDSLGL